MLIKKYWLFLLLGLFLLLPFQTILAGSSNLSKDNAYQAIVKVVTMGADENYDLYVSGYGSGVIINSSGLILTNNHVVTIEDDYDGSDEIAGFNICLNKSIDQEPDCNYQAKLIAKDKDLDIALLQIVSVTGSSLSVNFPYLDLSKQGVNINDELTALGFPAIGGDTVTITKGIVSGKLNKYNKNWIKTDAVISFGSSGGAAINTDGDVIGITSQAHSDLLGDMGYIIDINSVSNWINGNKTKAPQTNLLLNRMAKFIEQRQKMNDSNKFINNKPPYTIVKPSDWKFEYNSEFYLSITKAGDEESGGLSIDSRKYPYQLNNDFMTSYIDNMMIETGLVYMGEISKREVININNNQGELITFSGFGSSINFYIFIKGQYVTRISYNYGKNDKDKEVIDNIINSFTLTQGLPIDASVYYYENSEHNFNIKTAGNWIMEARNSRKSVLKIYNTKKNNISVEILVAKEDENSKRLTNAEFQKQFVKGMEAASQGLKIIGFEIEIIKSDINYKVSDQLNNIISVETLLKKIDTNENISRDLFYIIRKDGKTFIFVFEAIKTDKQAYDKIIPEFNAVLNGFSWESQGQQQPAPAPAPAPVFKPTPAPSFTPAPVPVPTPAPIPQLEPAEVNKELSKKLSGKILLQVEANGEAWYVYPSDLKRYYLKDGPTAYNALREFGLGITDTDLMKIPVGIEEQALGLDSDNDGLDDKTEEALGTDPNKADSDNDGYNDGQEVKNGYNPLGAGKININNIFAGKQEGKILLQVESRGEAWYVYDGKRYYMADGDFAYQIMRYLSLGITDDNLSQLAAGNF